MQKNKKLENPARAFRITGEEKNIPKVLELLDSQGFHSNAELFSPFCRTLTKEPFSLGRSLAAIFGLIYIQDRSSMLPPLFLVPEKGEAILDICAAPGGKTTFIAQLVGPHGFVLANEPNRERLTTLRQNVLKACSANVATCQSSDLGPILPKESFNKILLDPPCSAWGTLDKNPRARKIWSEDKVGGLINIQRKLLCAAAELCAPGGRTVYSTCTTNRAENEDQIRFALDNLPFELETLRPPEGLSFAADSPLPGTLRVDSLKSGSQGFFYAALKKSQDSGIEARLSDLESASASLSSTRPFVSSAPASKSRINWEALPPGDLLYFGNKLFLRPLLAPNRVPEKNDLRFFPLGRVRDNLFNPNPENRILMPAYPETEDLDTDDLTLINSLLAGGSLLASPGEDPCPGLYFKGFPLRRLQRKGKRILLPKGGVI